MDAYTQFDDFIKKYGTEGWRQCFESNPNTIISQEIMNKLQDICVLRAKELAEQGDSHFAVFANKG